MKTSQRGLDLIAQFEGLRTTAYLCPANVATIGFGTTRYPNGTAVKLSDPPINIKQAIEFLCNDVTRFERDINRLVKVTLNQNQFDALVSFTYNFGAGALEQSTLLRLINQGKANEAMTAKEFDRWINANGKPLEGLKKRRAAEKALFLRKD